MQIRDSDLTSLWRINLNTNIALQLLADLIEPNDRTLPPSGRTPRRSRKRLYSARRLRLQPDLAYDRPCSATPKICPTIHSLHGLPFGISGQSSSLKGRSTGLCFGVAFGGGMTVEAGFTSGSLDSIITSDKAMRHNDLKDLAQRCRLIAGKADAFTKRRLLDLAAQ
jgi:hypothetical protein